MMTGHIYFVQNFSGEIGFDQLHCVRPKNEMPVRRDTLKVPAISTLTFYPGFEKGMVAFFKPGGGMNGKGCPWQKVHAERNERQ